MVINIDINAIPGGEALRLKPNLPKRKPRFSIKTTGSKASCPSSSGKKFKNCCGREA